MDGRKVDREEKTPAAAGADRVEVGSERTGWCGESREDLHCSRSLERLQSRAPRRCITTPTRVR